VSLLRARKGPRTILGLLAALGLVAALAMPALATHVTPELIAGNDNKTCGELGTYGFEFKINETPSGFYDEDDSAVIVTPDVPTDFEVTITYNAETNVFSFTSNIAVEALFVKGGNDGGNLYEYDPPVTSDSGLQTPTAQEVSHISFCWTDAPQESEAPPSEAPPSEPAESTPASEAPSEPVEESEAPAESEAAPSESAREGELGGTPTPAPSGDLPDTAFGGDFGQMPATVLSLVLIGALAAMVYVRLARQR
jgi:hypothetical protein